MHLAALAVWAGAAIAFRVLVLRARRLGPDAELRARRRLGWLVVVEHVALVTALAAGFGLVRPTETAGGRPDWLDLKLGLTLFLIAPLELLHAWASYGWIARGLRETPAPPFSKDLERGVAVQDMLATMALPLLGVALPLIVWLSLSRPSW